MELKLLNDYTSFLCLCLSRGIDQVNLGNPGYVSKAFLASWILLCGSELGDLSINHAWGSHLKLSHFVCYILRFTVTEGLILTQVSTTVHETSNLSLWGKSCSPMQLSFHLRKFGVEAVYVGEITIYSAGCESRPPNSLRSTISCCQIED